MTSSTALTVPQAEEWTESLGQVAAGNFRQINLARDLGVPEALGLTLEEWVQDRLGGYVRMSIPDRREAVAELTEDGLSTREIGDVLGVDHKTVVNDRHAGEDSPAESDEVASDPKGDGPAGEDSPATRGQLANQAGGSDEWETPQGFFDELDREFGFDLDVCALPSSAKCERYFAPEDDGLAQEWVGTCWMNPPYGDEIGRWVQKAHDSSREGTTVVCLVPARVDTGWWWDHCRYGEVRFLRGRLRFGESDTSAPFPSAVVVFGREASVVWWERQR